MKAIMKKALSLVLAMMCVISFGKFLMVEATAETTLKWPVPGHYDVTQEYIDTPERNHNGIDILDKNILGAPVCAAMGGTVERVFNCTFHHDESNVSCYGYGTCVVIYGDDGRSYLYAHLLGGSIPSNVFEGAYIAGGTKIGQVGNTGYSYAAHLHFVVADGSDYLKNTIDPMSLTYGDHPDNASTLTIAGLKYPLHKESGGIFEVSGTVFSPNHIIYAEAQVLDMSGKVIFSIGTQKEDKRKVFDLKDFADQMDFSSLPDGTYQYSVCAVDEKGYSAQINNTFTVGSGETSAATADTLIGTHDCNEERVDAAYGWDDGVITKEPACSGVGIKTYTCKECGNRKTEDIPMLDHDFQESFTVDAEPSAKAVGYKSRHCNNCSAVTEVTEIPRQQTLILLIGAAVKCMLPIALCALLAFILWRVRQRGISEK